MLERLLPAMVTVALLLLAASTACRGAPPAEALVPGETADADSGPPALKRLAGHYTLSGDQDDSARKISNAIDAVTAEMGGLKRRVARKRLEDVNRVVTRISISSDQKNITISMNDYVITAPLDGSPAGISTPAGETAQATFQLRTATLVQDITRTGGRRENTFRFNSDGDLVMQVRETSPRLAAAVSYSLVYMRAGQ